MAKKKGIFGYPVGNTDPKKRGLAKNQPPKEKGKKGDGKKKK